MNGVIWTLIYLGLGLVFLGSTALIRKNKKGFLPCTEFMITRRIGTERLDRILRFIYLIILTAFWFLPAFLDLCLYINVLVGNDDVKNYFQEAKTF